MKRAFTLTFLTIASGYPWVTSANEAQPSFDCAKAESSAEELICTDAELARLDSRMADSFAKAMAAAQSLDAGSGDAVDDLRATQRGWIKGRDDCWKAQEERVCVMDAYLSREAELVTQWMLEDPLATVSYACEDNPANEITAMFFDTQLPSVRLEYGDSIDSGAQVRTASGSKYEASMGRSIWIKGSQATVVWPEGNEMSCVLVE